MNKDLKAIAEVIVLEKRLTVYGSKEEPLFLAKDVADWIDYNKDARGTVNTSQMLEIVDEDEKIKIYGKLESTIKVHTPAISMGATNRWFLTEDGIYEILMQSTKPIAKTFKKQVKKVLKEIRKNGSYASSMSTRKEQLLLSFFYGEIDRIEFEKLILELENNTIEINNTLQ